MTSKYQFVSDVKDKQEPLAICQLCQRQIGTIMSDVKGKLEPSSEGYMLIKMAKNSCRQSTIYIFPWRVYNSLSTLPLPQTETKTILETV